MWLLELNLFYSIRVNYDKGAQCVNKHPRRKRTGYLDELPEIKDFIAMLFKRCKQRGI